MNDIQREVYDHFALTEDMRSPSGWYVTDCPFCGKERHFGINFEPSRGNLSFNCYVCGESGATSKLLKHVGRTDILQFGRSVADEIEELNDPDQELDVIAPTVLPPYGFTPITYSPYLESRGFEPWQYPLYSCGYAPNSYLFKDYVIWLVKERGEVKGYVARSVWTKESIDEYNAWAKATGSMKHLRYRNDETGFGKLLFGMDELDDPMVNTVILVEGITDKANVDRMFRLHQHPHMKCCATFGKKISKAQIYKLHERGITNIILMFDADALAAMKEVAFAMDIEFQWVRCAVVLNGDPGDLDYPSITHIFEHLKTPSQVFANYIT